MCYLYVSCTLIAALLAFIEEANYVISESEQSVEVCVELKGRTDREVIIELFTEDNTAKSKIIV